MNRFVRFLAIAASATAAFLVLIAGASAAVAPPVTASPPTVEGQTVVGQTLSAGNGIWRNNPTSFSYQWLRCDANGNNCSKLSGATKRTYLLTKDDSGHTMVVYVTASNSGGSATANSHPSALVTPPAAPASTGVPTVTGRPIVGEQLVADAGQYGGGGVQSFAFQWERCDGAGGNCTLIAGATGQSYGVLKADVGHTLRVRVKATNRYGSTSSESKATPPVADQPVPPPVVVTTLSASSAATICCQSVRLSGIVSSGAAGEPITVVARQLGEIVDTTVATTTTTAGGNWSVLVTPEVETTYSAQTATRKSQPITVGVHPRVGLGVSGNNFSAKITGRDSFGGRVAYFQVASRSGQWQTVQLVVINLQSVARFHVSLRRGRTYLVRIYLPERQAGPGYLDGVSHTRRAGGTG